MSLMYLKMFFFSHKYWKLLDLVIIALPKDHRIEIQIQYIQYANGPS